MPRRPSPPRLVLLKRSTGPSASGTSAGTSGDRSVKRTTGAGEGNREGAEEEFASGSRPAPGGATAQVIPLR